jgi:hypothetical protein
VPADITAAARITFRLRQTSDNEEFQFGVSTGGRDIELWSTLLDDVASWYDDDGSSLVCQTTCDEVTYSEWESSGFTGWHQKASLMTAITSGTGAALPPQCAVTVSLLNLGSPEVSIKRRRGRAYVGLVPISQLDSAGRLTTGARALYASVIPTLQAAMNGVAAFDPAFSGICVASPTDGHLFIADKFGIGAGVDTQRRRRQKVSEGSVYADLA